MIKIKLLRLKKRMTLKDISKITGISDAYISQLENGKKANPTKEVLQKIATALGVPLSELLDES